jgi:hypothetical protein
MVRDMCMDCILGNKYLSVSLTLTKKFIYFSKKLWEKLEQKHSLIIYLSIKINQ